MHIYDKAFYVCLFFILGIGIASFGFDLLLSMVFMLGILLWAVARAGREVIIISPIILISFFYYHFHASMTEINIPMGDDIEFSGIVISDPGNKYKYQEFDISLGAPNAGRVRIYAERYPKFSYGDELMFVGDIEKSINGLIMSGFPDIKKVGEGGGNKIKSALLSIKKSLITNIEKSLPIEKAALASGILLGEKADFTDEFRDAMSKSGTSHIVALSGYNISVVAMSISAALGMLLKRRAVFYLSVASIILFVIMTGGEASIVRAALMGVLILLAEEIGRVYSFRNAIIIAASVMIAFDPRLLVFDLGFQLSFLALMGIIKLRPFIEERLSLDRESWRKGIKKIFLDTASAQVAVSPLLFASFGYVSPWGLIANVCILLFIPVTMLMAFITALSGFVSEGLSYAMGIFTGVLLGYEIFIINFFSFNWL